MKLAVFPNDDLELYMKKGEIRENYFNPNNMFDEIVLFNLSGEKALDEQAIQYMCGKATYKLIFLGEHSNIQTLLKLSKIVNKAITYLQKEKPDVIRSYGILFNSYIAAKSSEKLSIPYVISLHDHYVENRIFMRKSHNWMSYFFFLYWSVYHENYILKQANHVITVYQYAKQYAKQKGVLEEDITIIYNRVSDQFTPSKKPKGKSFTVINVMSQSWRKNQQVILQAIAQLPNVQGILIGSGPDHEKLKELAKELDCEKRVTFIPRVLNKELPLYYQKAHVFASSIKQGGVGIPDLEAFKTELPVIHAKSPKENPLDPLFSYAYMVDNTPEAFKDAIKKLQNKKTYEIYKRKSNKAAQHILSKKRDEQEERVYELVVG